MVADLHGEHGAGEGGQRRGLGVHRAAADQAIEVRPGLVVIGEGEEAGAVGHGQVEGDGHTGPLGQRHGLGGDLRARSTCPPVQSAEARRSLATA